MESRLVADRPGEPRRWDHTIRERDRPRRGFDGCERCYQGDYERSHSAQARRSQPLSQQVTALQPSGSLQ
jgi:hypothetical protein